jgi:hypothetical protein
MKNGHMATYTVRGHPELDAITDYDKGKLAEVIRKYNEWFERNVKESDREQKAKATWASAIYEINDMINKNMVDKLSTLEETTGYVGSGANTFFPVLVLFSKVRNIRREYLSKTPHRTLLNMEPEKLMPILDELEICTRHVIQNTSIRRLHAKSWVHSDALGVSGGGVSGRDDAWLAPGGISSLLGQMKETCI